MKVEKLDRISREICDAIKKGMEMSEEEKKKISWRDLEEIWFDYLYEELVEEEEQK
jgi:hypothetical protein